MAKVLDKKEVVTTYTLELTQKEVELIRALTGCITGGGEVREVSSGIFVELTEFTKYNYIDLFCHSKVTTREDFTFG